MDGKAAQQPAIDHNVFYLSYSRHLVEINITHQVIAHHSAIEAAQMQHDIAGTHIP